jgi:hypothetical protein
MEAESRPTNETWTEFTKRSRSFGDMERTSRCEIRLPTVDDADAIALDDRVTVLLRQPFRGLELRPR